MSYYYVREEVLDAVQRSSWLDVLYLVGGQSLVPALQRVGKHVPCPSPAHPRKKKGKGDGFRLFRDAAQTGGGICATCGSFPDGFALLMWLNGITFGECLRRVGDAIGAPRHKARSKSREIAPSNTAKDEEFETVKPANRFEEDDKAGSDNKTHINRRPVSTGIFTKIDTAPYRFDEKNDQAWYIQITNRKNTVKTLWGVDFTRAVDESKAEIGDLIEIRQLGRQDVEIEKEFVDKRTGEVSKRNVKSHRNTFHITVLRKGKRDNKKPDNHESTALSPHVESEVITTHSTEQPTSPEIPQWLYKVNEELASKQVRKKLYDGKLVKKYTEHFNEAATIDSDMAYTAQAYFRNRGFAAVIPSLSNSDAIRMHPAFDYYEEVENEKGEMQIKSIGKFPTLLGRVVDIDNNLVTLHRIYLTPEGAKAPVEHPKKMMTVEDSLEVAGCAIRLGGLPEDGVLGIAEGIETALAVYRATGLPCWSVISTALMTSVIIPDSIHTIIIWADLDASKAGEIAANTLKNRLVSEGYRVIVKMPNGKIPEHAKSIDWNDILQRDGILAFPRKNLIQRWIKTDTNESETAMKFSDLYI